MVVKTILVRIKEMSGDKERIFYKVFREKSYNSYKMMLETLNNYDEAEIIKMWDGDKTDLEIEQYKFHRYEEIKKARKRREEMRKKGYYSNN